MDFLNIDEYSLWLEPGEEDVKRINDLVSQINISNAFLNSLPHVTLLANIPLEDSVKDKMIKILAENASFGITFSRILSGHNILKTFYLECSKINELKDMNVSAKKIFEVQKEFKPHMSLFYGSIDEEIKEKMLKRAQRIEIEKFNFQPQVLSLWHAKGTPDKWKKIVSISFPRFDTLA